MNNRDSNRTQNFLYDSLNRIQQAYSSGPNWGETYSSTVTAPGVVPPSSGIDAWGNMTNHVGVTGKTNTEGTFGCPANVNNQLTACGLNYDAAGNVMSNNGVTYTYDAENRLVTPGAGNGTYLYDGDGNRMARLFNTSGTEYWRDLGGNTLLEDSNTGVNLREYIYFAGKKIARRDVVTNNVHYMFSDHLGSTSLMTDALGTMAACNGYTSGQFESDYYPYGGEMSICNNLGDQNYKFTGKERDAESGLDNFGKRYNASSLGRFMTPDPLQIMKQKLRDPQQWNMYSYTRNNPVRFVDPTGMYTTSCTQTDISKCDQNTQNFEKARQEALKSSDKNVAAAAKSYGNYGEKNNVAVGFQTKEASSVQFATDSKGSVTGINVSINSKTLSGITQEKAADGGTTLGFARAVADVAHEGSHVQTDQALIDHHMDPTFNITNRQSEHPAYKITDSVLRSYGWAGGDASGPLDLSNDSVIDKYLDSLPPEGQEPLDGHIYTPPQ